MSLRQHCLAMMVAFAVGAFPACRHEGPAQEGPAQTHPVKAAAAVPIQLTASGGNCLQDGQSGANEGIVPDGVSWTTTPSSNTIEIHLSAGCGFANGCDYGPTTGPITSGSSSLANGTTITYVMPMKINGQQCTLHGDGLIMHR